MVLLWLASVLRCWWHPVARWSFDQVFVPEALYSVLARLKSSVRSKLTSAASQDCAAQLEGVDRSLPRNLTRGEDVAASPWARAFTGSPVASGPEFLQDFRRVAEPPCGLFHRAAVGRLLAVLALVSDHLLSAA